MKSVDNRLIIIYENIEEDNKELAEIVIKEIDFTIKQMKKLKTQIRKNGAVEPFVQGKQNFLQRSSKLGC